MPFREGQEECTKKPRRIGRGFFLVCVRRRVDDELPVDGVADVALQGADRFSFGLAFGDFAVDVDAAG